MTTPDTKTAVQHTPGDWFISARVRRSDGFMIYHLDSDKEGPFGYFDTLYSESEGDGEGDAALVIAGPRLLKAAKALIAQYDAPGGPAITKQVNALRAALAAATPTSGER